MRHALWLTAILVVVPASSRAADSDFFEAKIRPVLVEHCYACHSTEAEGKKKLRGGLKLDTAPATRAGGDTGPSLVPGKPAESVLIKALKGQGAEVMPPKGRLSAAIIADFEKWIADGASDPRTAVVAKPTGMNIEAGRQHWAFQPPKANPKFPTAAIDGWVGVKLAEKGLVAAPPADKRTLIRRATFDLIGLPPTPAEVEAFANDTSPDAYAKLIDRLLASPHYGERWARHWLDVARYAEDQAHTFAVKPRANAWRYRDWVIAAFNADMPYDRFVTLQLAGDLMPDDNTDPITKLAGLGLLGLGAEYYKNSDAAQAIADELDDRVDVVTRGFLGLTVSCARCHDHKFDPIPTTDYYALAGIFNGSQFADLPLAAADQVKAYDAAQAKLKEADDKVKSWLTDQARNQAESEVPKTAQYVAVAKASGKWAIGLNPKFVKQWVKYLDPKNSGKLTPTLNGASPAEFQVKLSAAVAARSAKPTKEQAELMKAMFVDKTSPFFVDPAEVEKSLAVTERETLKGMRAELDARRKAVPPMYPVAHAVKGGGQAMKVFVRGNPHKPGEPAPKGFPQVLSQPGREPAKDFTRLDLAKAIASPENPLTARVIVNRVWAQHFGRGLVATPSNFGTLGDRPTHPELLDTLAVGFMQNGWSLKWLHRQILTSATYSQSADGDPKNAEIDGDNQYLWHANRRRLEVEPWRDALLAVAGRLDPATGGPNTNLRDASNTRRTVYAKVSRHELDSLLRLFDFPDANVTADKRTMTTVPQQQLFVLNAEFVVTQAKAFAARLAKDATSDDERIRLAYRIAYGRLPSSDEIRIGHAFLSSPVITTDKLSKWEQYSQALLASNEFLYVD